MTLIDKKGATSCLFSVISQSEEPQLNTKAYALQKTCKRQDNEETF